jgi:adenylate cyclase class 2
MLEVEMKFPISDFVSVEARLAQQNAEKKASRRDVDHYFNAPDRDFARTDEALRLRRIGTANFVTYKGPKRDSQTKTRTELEVVLGQGDEAANTFVEILKRLGYRPVAVVSKQRQVFHLERAGFELEVTLDDVDGVGRFVELEILAPEQDLEPARAVLLQLAAELGLSSSERRSYLELLLAAREKKA